MLHPEHTGEWLLLHEPFNIDSLALRCWQTFPHRREPFYLRVAYEIKVSWQDFRRELERPAKRANAERLAHEFWFAMPRELALRALEERLLPEGCGLVQVFEDDGRAAPLVRPLRRDSVPGWSERELVTLMRWRLNPNRERSLQGRLAAAEQDARSCADRVEEMRGDRDGALTALERLSGDLVQEGSLWVGEYRGEQGAAVEALSVSVFADGSSHVRLRRVGDGSAYYSTEYATRGEVLARFRPLDDAEEGG